MYDHPPATSNHKELDVMKLAANDAFMSMAFYAGNTIFSTTANQSGFGSTPHGALAILNYSSNTGKEMNWPFLIPLGLHKTQRESFYRQCNGLFEVAEKTVKPGKTYCFSSTTSADEVSDEFWQANYRDRRAITTQVSADWWLVFAGAANALTAEVTCCEKNGTISYTAKINYHVYDYYDWDDHMLGLSHQYGLARNFFQKGSISFEVNWIKGKRYPKSIGVNSTIDITEFEGIDHGDLLKNAYNDGLIFYNNVNTGNLVELIKSPHCIFDEEYKELLDKYFNYITLSN